MEMSKRIIFIVLFLGLSIPAFAQSQVGTTASSFLEIPVGARSIGMGEAYVSVVDEISALYWNPAGVTNLKTNQATFQNTEWFVDTKLYYAASVFKFNDIYLGASVYMFDGGEMDVRTVTFPDGTGERFSVQDISIGLTYAQKLTENFGIGGTVKFVQNQIWRMKASTIALDMGFQYQTPFEATKLGFSISNFGGEMSLKGDNTYVPVDLDPNNSGNNDGIPANLRTGSWDLPLIFRLGLNTEVIKKIEHRLIISVDAIYPNNNNNYINTGTEYAFRKTLFLRAGYSNLFISDSYGLGHLRFGVGIAPVDNISIDYALSERDELGYIHTIGASLKF
jgi:long-subunit fatty acid transport protein